MSIPIYGQDNKNLPEGMYIGFFHGRNTSEEELEDWGFDGPTIGPLQFWHTTYESHIRGEIHPETLEGRVLLQEYIEAELVKDYSYGSNGMHIPVGLFELSTKDGLACVGGKYYGDWTIYYHKNKE